MGVAPVSWKLDEVFDGVEGFLVGTPLPAVVIEGLP